MTRAIDLKTEQDKTPEDSSEKLSEAREGIRGAITEFSQRGIGKVLVGPKGDVGLVMPIHPYVDNPVTDSHKDITREYPALSRTRIIDGEERYLLDATKIIGDLTRYHAVISSDGRFMLVGAGFTWRDIYPYGPEGDNLKAKKDRELYSEYNRGYKKALSQAEESLGGESDKTAYDALRDSFIEQVNRNYIVLDSENSSEYLIGSGNRDRIMEVLGNMVETAILVAEHNNRCWKYKDGKKPGVEPIKDVDSQAELSDESVEWAVELSKRLGEVMAKIDTLPEPNNPSPRTQPE